MDAVCVLTNNKVLPIYFRFSYQILKNLNVSKLKSKQFNSKPIAKNYGYTVPPNFYYVFESNVIEQVRRRFRNLTHNYRKFINQSQFKI